MDFVITCYDPLDFRIFYKLDLSASRERGCDEQHLEDRRPVVHVVHCGAILEGG